MISRFLVTRARLPLLIYLLFLIVKYFSTATCVNLLLLVFTDQLGENLFGKEKKILGENLFSLMSDLSKSAIYHTFGEKMLEKV